MTNDGHRSRCIPSRCLDLGRAWRNHRFIVLPSLICALMMVCPGSARATVMNIQLTGHVLPVITGNPNMGLDQYGFFGGGPGSQINGDAYSATIVYDTGLAPADSNPAVNAGNYSRDCDPCTTSANGQPFLSIAITINGITETITGADHLETAIVSYSTSPLQDTISFEAANHTSVSTTGTPFDESYADFTFTSIVGKLLAAGDALPTSVDLTALLNPGPTTKIGDLSILTGVYGNPDIIDQSVYAYLSLDSISVWSPPSIPVPEPSSLALILPPLTMLGLGLRRERRRASLARAVVDLVRG